MLRDIALSPAEWASLRRLLDEALDLPEADRSDWLERLDETHDPLKPRLRALLSHAAAPGAAGLLDALPRIETADFADALSADADAPSRRVGPYRLLRQIGEGG